MIIGALTLEEANMTPDATIGTLKKVESLILTLGMKTRINIRSRFPFHIFIYA